MVAYPMTYRKLHDVSQDTEYTMPVSLFPLGGALILLMIDSAIGLALVSSMVGYLHRSGANEYPFASGTATTLLNAKPKGLLLNQGHTSNGAAGTALVLLSFGGFLVLWLQRRRAQKGQTQRPSRIFLAYTICTILSFLLTVAALAYTFSLTNQTKGQSIDTAVAARFQGHAYPLDHWTPETWTKALLALPLTSSVDRSYLEHWLKVMEGWRWNLIPLMLSGLLVMVLSVRECMRDWRGGRGMKG